MIRRPLPYHPSLGHLLRQHSPGSSHAFWLRPGRLNEEFFGAYPTDFIKLLQQDSNGISGDSLKDSQSWSLLKKLKDATPNESGLYDLAFRGGIAGFTGYGTNGSPPGASPNFPKTFWALYPRFIHIDHYRRTAEEVVLGDGSERSTEWSQLIRVVTTPSAPAPINFTLHTPFQPLTDKEKYISNFSKIQSYLKEGDCYQVNYAQAFKARCSGNSADAMQRLLEVSDPAYAAWLSIPEGDVLCLSPELFIKTEGRHILTKPIKGTAPRRQDPDEDAAQADTLQHSTKNRAENLMIVDLLRHDISQHAEIGSVKVDKLFDIESLPQVHHMVSTITARLKEGSTSIDLIRDCFPGGSITGAPKKRAMEIIEELEPTPRSIYCGSIGFINPDGDCQLNIAIRTLLHVGDEIYAWAGGGIVADSDCEAEYQECFDKMGALMRALEEMGKTSPDTNKPTHEQ